MDQKPGLDNADIFAVNLRRIARLDDKSIKGSICLSDDMRLRLTALAARFNDTADAACLEKMLLGTAELARRCKITVPEALWPGIGRGLLRDLTRNAASLNNGRSAANFAQLTIYTGATFADAPRDPEFADLADTPWIFKRAAEGHPRAPAAFLRQVQADIAAIAGDPEFADFADTPGIVKYAVVNFRRGPAVFLRRVRADISSLAANPEFAAFADTPHILKQAAIQHADPAAFLRLVQADAARLAADPEFTAFADTPWVFRAAVANNAKNPTAFLRQVQASLADIKADPEFAALADTPGVVRYAATGYPTDPKAYLRKYMNGDIAYGRTRYTP